MFACGVVVSRRSCAAGCYMEGLTEIVEDGVRGWDAVDELAGGIDG